MIESFVFLGLSLNAWITIVLVLVMFGLLLFTKLPADVVFVGGMAVHGWFGCECGGMLGARCGRFALLMRVW